MIEHRHSLETTLRSKPGTNGRTKQTFYRFVCDCGAVTGWRLNIVHARRERDQHALDGQRSFTLDVSL